MSTHSQYASGFSPIDAVREKSSRKRRLEADSESGVSGKRDDEYADFKKFHAFPKHGEFKWGIPENLIKYTIDDFHKFIPEKIYKKAFWFKT